MYAFIEGKIAGINPAEVVIDCRGVGYDISISVNTYSQIKDLETCRLLTHLAVKEDAMVLYGFAREEERQLFRQLISVSGVGAGTARLILSSLTPEEVTDAIILGNVPVLQRVKGIGGKTAQRIIIDLKDKLGKGQGFREILGSTHNTKKEEALSALSMLGFNKALAEKTIDRILKEEGTSLTVEQLIKHALRIL
ncbi:Holliday junction branch migration protein RuvA [Lentimicrobium sp.]|jgi:Holliday junction DNA helicase RuvA|uniref:Holliday junction branch migration protein RuvA n=1 Tax=Lentimicrobium sp. TaxID=2034841 RepID=UPI0025D2CD05|nr:Holliday junction branch migration protein RuvA [Lentimicrobium sp.]MCO5257733.1 Holliday junction branch migration protein RuvA [Lentimicrobium sp.]MCO5261320.1 Holliday junction branch migration protein RuvA [Lentimicrobium sp.]HPJ62687.1 Holliday junction branch migration protein RuvA [Lentimicrobium sp.]HPR24785.1 Holliday junction branch migration protein RuvA [Lentimicrobium sp.]HRW70093.1 Holliday junction branch migration protein RuvA [Lentimicrobium sp.]